jgi:hypothetical protein
MIGGFPPCATVRKVRFPEFAIAPNSARKAEVLRETAWALRGEGVGGIDSL